jgi:vancomycin resistance protein YoaR
MSSVLTPAVAVALVLAALALDAPAGAVTDQELVSKFTTRYPCCQGRVTNIRRAAVLLDGRVLQPGQRFSMNAALGKRTRARGFVAAPMISGGATVASVGGGISQVATTLFNAAFFAGLKLVAHRPHSLYISRYPMGREATISWGGPELIFDNDWPAPVWIQLRTTRTSISVLLYPRVWGDMSQPLRALPMAS